MTGRTDLRGARVLVTGASGFIGGRLVEQLCQVHDATVRVLARTLVSVRPLARFPIEVATGDVLDTAALAEATAGCEIVFNCVKGTSGVPAERRAVDADGTGNLIDAATAAGAARVVHLSTARVYDIPRSGSYDETTPRITSGELYAETKLAGEQVALSRARERGAPVTVIQPTVVYGPNSGVYGRDIIEELRDTRIPLIDGGEGICNALYIDDLVTAICLAATSPGAPGEAFLVSGPAPVTWKEFYAAFESMLGVHGRTVPMSEQDALAYWRRSSRRTWLLPELTRIFREDPVLRRRLFETREGALVERLARRLLPESFWRASDRWFEPPPAQALQTTRAVEDPVVAFRPDLVRVLANRTTARIDKARRVLGYEPAIDFATGMQLTERWARWAGLLGE